MNASQIATFINEVYAGVERSKLGPITDKNDAGVKIINTLPSNVFVALINSLSPKNISTTVKEE